MFHFFVDGDVSNQVGIVKEIKSIVNSAGIQEPDTEHKFMHGKSFVSISWIYWLITLINRLMEEESEILSQLKCPEQSHVIGEIFQIIGLQTQCLTSNPQFFIAQLPDEKFNHFCHCIVASESAIHNHLLDTF